jgi:transposase, IS5 family
MKNINPRGLFDESFRLERLIELNDPLITVNKLIDWEIFREDLTNVFAREPKGAGGRPAFNYIMMFKILILQRLYNLSDDQIEYQITDRISFMRFLGLSLSDKVPDSKTVWNFREILALTKVVDKLFDKFTYELQNKGLIANEGRIIDASFVEVPRQRNKREDNLQIKQGQTPQDWLDKPNKLEQKDLDARWTKKNNETFYGYKDHVKIDAKSKIILKFKVTDASVHDSQPLENLLDEEDKGQPLHADSAYSGDPIAKVVESKEIKNQIHEKGYKKKPLTEEQKAKNKEKSRIRVRVEHVFGFIENSMKGSYIRTIGFIRAKAVIGLMNLTYNLCRYIQLQELAMAKCAQM